MKPYPIHSEGEFPQEVGEGGASSAESRLETVIHDLLEEIGEDPTRPGLLKTPERVARAWDYLTSGHGTDLTELVNGAIFEEDCNEIVAVKKIHFFSLCEHHLLPFFGVCSVAYVPNGRIIGISKIPRIVDMFSRRLQVQERLTKQVAEALNEVLAPAGVAVIMEAFHLCTMMRGVQKQDSRTVTSEMVGVFKTNPQTRQEFLQLMGASAL